MGASMSLKPHLSNNHSGYPSMYCLPDAAIPAMEDAISSLIERSVPISTVWAAFLADLEVLGISPPCRFEFNQWAMRIVEGDYDAVGVCQSNGELRPSSAKLLVKVMRIQAVKFARIARLLRRSADDIATAILAEGSAT